MPDTSQYVVNSLLGERTESILTEKISYVQITGPKNHPGRNNGIVGLGVGLAIGTAIFVSNYSSDCDSESGCIGQVLINRYSLIGIPVLGLAGALFGSSTAKPEKRRYKIVHEASGVYVCEL